MKQIFLTGMIALATALLWAVSACCGDMAVPGELVEETGIVYRTVEGSPRVLDGNLYRPADGTLLPGIVLVHGGGFVAGSKDAWNVPEVGRYMANKGFVIFSIDYRLLQDGALFPENAQDVKCAVQWLRAHAEKYKADPSRFAVMGLSAGGYMASFVGVTQHNEKFNTSCGDPALDAQKPEVDLVAAWYGVHDFMTMPGRLMKTLEMMYFVKIKDKKAFKKEISPITYADQSPPMFMVHGQADQLVPIQQSRDMCAAINAAGGDCTLIEYPETGHGFVDEQYAEGHAFEAMDSTAEWLHEHFAAMTAAK